MYEMKDMLGTSPTDKVAISAYTFCNAVAVFGTPLVIAKAIPDLWDLIDWNGKCNRIRSRKPRLMLNFLLFEIPTGLVYVLYASFSITEATEVIEAKIIAIAYYSCLQIFY